MTVSIYNSTDTGAPSLTGQAGSLIALLDAVLVSGYNSKSVTSITRSGSVATLTATAHGFVAGDVVLVSGANQTEYNGAFIISNVTANTFDYTVTGTPATPATGTITVKKAPAGWTKDFSGTNLAAYKQGGGNSFYLRVDDTVATYARVVGYEAMTDVNTGTNAFPTSVQFSGGLYWVKSSAADATTRPWVAVATNQHLYLFVATDTASPPAYGHFYVFGGFKSYRPADAYSTGLIGNAASGNTTATAFLALLASGGLTTACTGHYIARSYTQLGSSITVGKSTDANKSNMATSVGSAGMPYPNGPNGALYLAPLWLSESATSVLRGELPGLWSPLHSRPLSHLDTFNGTEGLVGKKFLVLNLGGSGQVFVETSNTWSL